MTEEEMKLAGIYLDENGRYCMVPRSKEEQEIFDEYVRVYDEEEK